ncbi:Late embryogenesis abundant protein 1-like protein [Drosera capensis]
MLRRLISSHLRPLASSLSSSSAATPPHHHRIWERISWRSLIPSVLSAPRLASEFLEAPAFVKSVYDERIVGCPGGEGVGSCWAKQDHPMATTTKRNMLTDRRKFAANSILRRKMASQQSHELKSQAQDATAHAQEKTEGVMSQVSQAASGAAQQTTQFLQQTGEQVKSMAQGAAEAVKSTLGMNNADSTETTSTTTTTSPAVAAGTTSPSPNTASGSLGLASQSNAH